jgi:hypothetical protein
MKRCSARTNTGRRCKKVSKEIFCCVHREEEPVACGICLENVPRHRKTSLECGHKFCPDCIKEWLIENNFKYATCPCCRTQVTKNEYDSAIKWGVDNEKLWCTLVIKYSLENMDKDDLYCMIDNFEIRNLYTPEEFQTLKEVMSCRQTIIDYMDNPINFSTVQVMIRSKYFPEKPVLLYEFS